MYSSLKSIHAADSITACFVRWVSVCLRELPFTNAHLINFMCICLCVTVLFPRLCVSMRACWWPRNTIYWLKKTETSFDANDGIYFHLNLNSLSIYSLSFLFFRNSLSLVLMRQSRGIAASRIRYSVVKFIAYESESFLTFDKRFGFVKSQSSIVWLVRLAETVNKARQIVLLHKSFATRLSCGVAVVRLSRVKGRIKSNLMNFATIKR